MLDTLTESGTSRRRSTHTALVAAVVHGLLVAAAVSATQPHAATPDTGPLGRDMIFVPPASASTAPRAPVSASLRAAPTPTAVTPVAPAPGLSITALEPVSPRAPDLAALTRAGATETPSASGVMGHTGSGDDILSAEMVDEPVAMLQQRPPPYPRALELAGAAGRVVLEFVVDSAGRVEAGSVRVVESSAAGFEEAAREAVLSARFRPARAAGRVVRQLVRQAMTFVTGR